MRDKTSQARIDLLHPKLRAEVKQLIEKAESQISPRLAIRVVQGLRTIDEQNALYAKGRTTPGPRVTNAKGGSSFHNYGLAIDFAFLVDGKEISWDTAKDWDGDKMSDWLEVSKVFIAGGYTWGGLFKSIKDFPHFEKSFGNTWQQLLKLYNAGKFISGTKYVAV